MNTEHKTEKGTISFIIVSKDASGYKLEDNILIIDEKYGINKVCFNVLDGSEFIGLTGEVTEEQVKMMVDETLIFTKHKVKSYQFKSYIDGFMGFDTALDSFKSLMQHLKLTDEKWIVLFKPND